MDTISPMDGTCFWPRLPVFSLIDVWLSLKHQRLAMPSQTGPSMAEIPRTLDLGWAGRGRREGCDGSLVMRPESPEVPG
jgi:hypothetical protein